MTHKELITHVEDLKSSFKITDFEALQIVVKKEFTQAFKEAYLVNNLNYPTALEKIAMEIERFNDKV